MTQKNINDPSLEEIINRNITPEEVTPATAEEVKTTQKNILSQALEMLNNP